MEVFYRVVALLGGLALFLYGMQIMGNGLKSSSGGALKAVLAKVTGSPLKGFLLGLLVTCMVQSSTATIVLTVGLVGAGYLAFKQAIGIVLGANVGTAITAQIIRLMDVQADAGSLLNFFKSSNLAPMALLIGIILIMFVKSDKADVAGSICMGFGILFVGLMNMSAAVESFSESLGVLLTSFSNNYLLGFLSGVFVTGVIQSSSAVVGILQSIASSIGIAFSAVFAVIIGVNIGDCLTTYLVCRLGAKPDQIRTCMFHIIYNVSAALLLFIGLFVGRSTGLIGDNLWNMVLDSGGVANVHGLFRLIPAVLFLPISPLLGRIAQNLVKDEVVSDEDADLASDVRELDQRLVTSPTFALRESGDLILRMAESARHNFDSAIKLIDEYDDKRESRIREREERVDRMADQASRFLVAVSSNIEMENEMREQYFQYKAVTCIERIGDLAVNIAESARHMKDMKKISAKDDLYVAAGAVYEILDITVEAIRDDDPATARRVEPLEEAVDEIVGILQTRVMKRMMNETDDIISGTQFQNVLLNLERISDQCSDLAAYLIAKTDDSVYGSEHTYIHELHHSDDEEYHKLYRENLERYTSLMSEI